jgi:hypothetical protein
VADAAEAAKVAERGLAERGTTAGPRDVTDTGDMAGARAQKKADTEDERFVEIETQGNGPLVVREKIHAATPMGIDQALFEMELVGHDFFLFTDAASGLPSVVYRRRGYQYGVIRLVDERAPIDVGAARQQAGVTSA